MRISGATQRRWPPTRCGQTGARTPVVVAAARSSTGQDRHPPAQAAVPAGTARTAPPTAEGHMPKPSDGSALRVSVFGTRTGCRRVASTCTTVGAVAAATVGAIANRGVTPRGSTSSPAAGVPRTVLRGRRRIVTGRSSHRSCVATFPITYRPSRINAAAALVVRRHRTGSAGQPGGPGR